MQENLTMTLLIWVVKYLKRIYCCYKFLLNSLNLSKMSEIQNITSEVYIFIKKVYMNIFQTVFPRGDRLLYWRRFWFNSFETVYTEIIKFGMLVKLLMLNQVFFAEFQIFNQTRGVLEVLRVKLTMFLIYIFLYLNLKIQYLKCFYIKCYKC